jgi:hypothetical protein
MNVRYEFSRAVAYGRCKDQNVSRVVVYNEQNKVRSASNTFRYTYSSSAFNASKNRRHFAWPTLLRWWLHHTTKTRARTHTQGITEKEENNDNRTSCEQPTGE